MRFFLDLIEHRLSEIDRRSRELLATLDDGSIYRRPAEAELTMFPFSCGEYLVRSAATIEQTFGGITTRLWDDPFEWTLPEKLSTIESVSEYLDEVTTIRRKGMGFFTSDDDLKRSIPSPEKLRTLGEILFSTIAQSEYSLGQAAAFKQIYVRSAAPPR